MCYSPVAFKHGCSLETSGALVKKSNTWAFVFFKKLQDNSDVHLDIRMHFCLLGWGIWLLKDFYVLMLTVHTQGQMLVKSGSC